MDSKCEIILWMLLGHFHGKGIQHVRLACAISANQNHPWKFVSHCHESVLIFGPETPSEDVVKMPRFFNPSQAFIQHLLPNWCLARTCHKGTKFKNGLELFNKGIELFN